MPLIVVGSTPIQFPDSAQSPDWSEAVIQFAQAVASSLNTVVGPFDVPAQSFLFASSGLQDVPNLQFSAGAVRAAYVKYSIFRTTSTTTEYEAGQFIAVYNPNNPPGNLWDIIIERVGDSLTVISIDDDGQVKINPTALSGTGAINKISYSAQAFAQ